MSININRVCARLCRDWPEFLANATDVVIKNLIEVEEEEELEQELKKSINTGTEFIN